MRNGACRRRRREAAARGSSEKPGARLAVHANLSEGVAPLGSGPAAVEIPVGAHNPFAEAVALDGDRTEEARATKEGCLTGSRSRNGQGSGTEDEGQDQGGKSRQLHHVFLSCKELILPRSPTSSSVVA